MDENPRKQNILLKIQQAGADLDIVDECVFNLAAIHVGRATENDLVLNDPRISRRHLRIDCAGNQLTVTDLGSANGTKVNGTLVAPRAPVPLRFGQPVSLPGYQITLTPAPGSETRALTGSMTFSGLPQPTLTVVLFGQPQEAYPLEQHARLGRAPDNDIVIDHPLVSRYHAEVTRRDGSYVITDCGSKNGLYLNGSKIQSRALHSGDTLQIHQGEVELRYSAYAGLQPAEQAKAQPARSVTLFRMPAMDQGLLNLKGMDTITIGRGDDNRVILTHPQVSLHHALIERVGGRYRIKDLKSTAGTFVNEKKVEKEAWLKIGDVISIAGFKMILQEIGIQHIGEEGLRLDVLGLNKWVSQKKNLLQNISLCIQPQEFVAVVGMSGSGKSTLMDAINGFRPATHGQVRVNGTDLYHNFDLFRNEMGYVPQKDIVHQELTVYSALDYTAQLRMPPDTAPAERHQRIMEVLDDLDLTERKDLPIHKLSGGQLKRVSIGVELLTRPRLFFLDEPTSGLDPGTEAEMMRLLRQLADQGRTILLITHATKNVMMCDQVIFLARGGYLAYFGPPEEALAYFDQFRGEQEQQQADIEFDDIYKILNDESRGSGPDWQRRYLESPAYRTHVVERIKKEPNPPAPFPKKEGGVDLSGDLLSNYGSIANRQGQKPPPSFLGRGAGGVGPPHRPQTNSLRQFLILSSRNLKIIRQDKFALALMLAIAPIIGLMDFMWGTSLFDVQAGDAKKIVIMLFMCGLIAILVGAMGSVREIVKEVDIYKRERAINLRLVSYILSKIWVGVVLSLYQAVVLVFFLYIFALYKSPLGAREYLLFVGTMFLGTLSGYLMGLWISAAAPNQNVALLLVIVVLVPQFLFSGALLPLDLIPGGSTISAGVSTRWAFEAMVNVTGIGRDVVADPCWKQVIDKKIQMKDLNDDQKAQMGCLCAGVRMFESCYFPGIQDPDYYDTPAKAALAAPEPLEPTSPPDLATYTPVPTYTAVPSPTNMPTPRLQSQAAMADYQATQVQQGADYQKTREAQGSEYQDAREKQGDIYRDASKTQGEAYKDAVKQYADDRKVWQSERDTAIKGAEGEINGILDNFGRTFTGSVVSRWVAMGIIMIAIFGLLVVFQKLKDRV